jgi:hypothetical protein
MNHTICFIAALFVSAAAASAQTTDVTRTGRDTTRTDLTRSVTLSLTEYNRLIDLASRQTGTTPVPVPAVVSSADLRIRVERDSAHGTFYLAGDVLRAGLNRVNLVSGATILDGSIDGQALPLVADNGTHAAFLQGPGPFALSLEWGTPLTFAPGRGSFVLPVPLAGTAHATLDLPGDQADLHVSAGMVTRRTTSNGRTILEATLRPGTQTEVWWSMRDSAPVAAAREVRMLADVFTLVTVNDADLRMATLVDVTIAQGEPRTIEVRLPSDFEVAGVSGSGIESSEPRDGGLVVTVANPAVKRHQFLITLERTHVVGSFRAETDFIALPGVQRERGEIAIEGVGTLDLGAAERNGMHRIDVRELNGALQSLARQPLLAAFRYQRAAATQVALTLNVQRFPDAGVLSAVAERATATTLISSEGRALTEIRLQVRNRAQPFVRVTLPEGATIVSAEVGGESAKPVIGSDGTRMPLLRPGYRPTGSYSVSYVYLHAGQPLARRGDLQMALPRMDIPIELLEWEMFVPERYRVQLVDGNVLPKELLITRDQMTWLGPAASGGIAGESHQSSAREGSSAKESVASPAAGPVNSPQARSAAADAKKTEPSQNVIDLQRRAAGVLPIRVDVPRAGTSHQFVKPLVVDQEATVKLRYKERR